MSEALPLRLGITMGDPLGVGPEVILKALRTHLGEGSREHSRPLAGRFEAEVVVYATPGVLEGAPGPPLQPGPGLRVESVPAPLPVFTPEGAGAAALACLERGADDLSAGRLDALVTGPVDKHRIATAAGRPFRGQTEFLAARLGRPEQDVVMMLAGPVLRVALATTHLPLRDVPAALSAEGVASRLIATAKGLREDLGLPDPKIAVAALNPHAGEKGMTGTEEAAILLPAMERARRAGVALVGPLPADSLFPRAVRGEFDAVFCQYHDQGLIPLKLVHPRDAANVTLGLGTVRTSPDHGTAEDIAGKGIADPGSMVRAIRMALEMAARRRDRGSLPLRPGV